MSRSCTSHWLRLLCASLVLVAAVGCTSDEGTLSGGDSASASADPVEEETIPPLAFSPEPDAAVEAQDYFVDGTVLYSLEYGTSYYDENEAIIRAIDFEEDMEVGQAVPEHDRPFEDVLDQSDTAFVKTGDEVVLLHAWEESGTVSLRAFGADDGGLHYTGEAESEIDGQGLSIVQADEQHVLVVMDGYRRVDYQSYESAMSFLFDTATGDLLWSGADFDAAGVLEGAVGGVAYTEDERQELRVVDFEDGAVGYSYETDRRLKVDDIGGGLLLMVEGEHFEGVFADDVYHAAVVDLEMTEVLVEADTVATPSCFYDQVAIVGCLNWDSEEISAFTAEEGQILWTADDVGGDRLIPDRWLASFGGVFYMDNAEGARPPVAIEAATGEWLAEDLVPGMVEVGPGYAVAIEQAWSHTSIGVFAEVEQ
ncbi:hypothetical protein [Glycomyces salinus]|uniref:hypothetical protein n=1 Tax=Glycomyces salinus TaxID=980294 RepID=UPI0018ECE16C|nr:hypothetical protein [Glycomyces salinus]